MGAVDPVGTIEIDQSAARKPVRGTSEKPNRRTPGRDVHHVDGDDGDNVFEVVRRPTVFSGVDVQRCAYVEAFVFGPGGDRLPGLWVGIARLPGEMGKLAAKGDDVLTRPGGDFKDGSRLRQIVPEHVENRLSIS